MEMSKDELIEYKRILLKSLKDFDCFCTSFNLKYSLAYGSVIGALRHEGFIPWDDDIDVIMPKTDYERLLSLKSELAEYYNESYELQTYQNSNYYLPFAKFCDCSSTVFEFKNHPYIFGAYIDIFPLYETEGREYLRNFRSMNRYFDYYAMTLLNFNIADFFHEVKNLHVRQALTYLQSVLLRPFKSIFFKKFKKYELLMSNKKGNYCYSISHLYGLKNFYPKTMIFPTKRTLFEGVEVNIPNNPHEYCTQLYGDYMKLPPLDKQITHHFFYYFNLHKRLTLSEVFTKLQ